MRKREGVSGFRYMKKSQNEVQIIWLVLVVLVMGLSYGVWYYRDQASEVMSEKVESSFRVALIADIDHCPSREAVSLDNLERFLSQVNQKDADFLVSLGDVASHRLRQCSETADMDARFIAEKLRLSGKPAYLVLGDHDIESSEKSFHTWLETTEQKETHYSFDTKNVHVVVLDTVLGGESLSPPCEEREDCQRLMERQMRFRTDSYVRYRSRYPEAQTNRAKEWSVLEAALEAKRQEISMTRSWDHRGRGWVSEQELRWLKQDLESTPFERVVLLSSHFLFPFVYGGQEHDIVNGDRVRMILEQSGKQVVALSGEAHLWHEEKRNGVQYYVINEFRQDGGSWAFFSWMPDGYFFEKISH